MGRWPLPSSLGTEDGEFLAAGAEKPRPCTATISEGLSISSVEYAEGGLSSPAVRPPNQREVIQVQFVVAWAVYDWECPASWFAVDQNPAILIQQLIVTKPAGS